MDIKQATAANIMMLMVDSADHLAGKTGLTLAVAVSKGGGAFNNITPTVTERGNGWYNIALADTDTGTLGDLVVRSTATGADPGERLLTVVANSSADIYTRLGAPAGASVSADIAANSGMISTVAGYTDSVEANLTTLLGDAGTIKGYTDSIENSLATLGADIATIKNNTDSVESDIAALPEAILNSALPETYPVDGATMTVSEALYMLRAMMAEAQRSGSTLTCKKIDGTTTAMTFTLSTDQTGNVTGVTRAS